MSDFKAKYHALQLMQQLASGDASLYPRSQDASSPRKQKVRTSDDILQEKYEELAELMAVQRLEQRAVSTLQKMYVSPKRSDRRSRRRRRRADDERREDRGRGKGGGRMRNDSKRDDDDLLQTNRIKNQRPQSASSNSTFSSYSSAKSSSSKTSAQSHSSRHSSTSYGSKRSSRSSASSNTSRTSTRSNSSKMMERHFVTIVEEEEEEEVVNQDAIKERQVVRYDEELAKENQEEAQLKNDASKRTRKVSFVLEAEEQSSDGDEQSDDSVKDEDRYVSGEEDQDRHKSYDRKITEERLEKEQVDYRKSKEDQRTKYIEIEESILREILSPRSPRRMPKLSPRSEERSPTRSRSKSPQRRRNVSPSSSRDLNRSLALPPRPKRDISPCDHKLSSTDNPDIKKWLRHKNALTRRQRKAELKKEREKRLEEEAKERQKMTKHEESIQLYDSWLRHKQKEQRKQRKLDKRAAKEEKKKEEEERLKREEDGIAAFGEKLPTPRQKVSKKRKSKSKKDSGKKESDDKGVEGENAKGRSFPSSNPFKGLTYDQWMKQKLEQGEAKKKRERKQKKTDPDLEEIIPSIAKERIQRATTGKGKRVDSGLNKDREDLPECDRPSETMEKGRADTWKNKGEKAKARPQKSKDNHETSKCGKENLPGGCQTSPKRVGLQRPSTSRNRLSNSRDGSRFESRSESARKLYEQVFSPSFARPEPYGSESNDDHSECSAKLAKGKPGAADKNNNGHGHKSSHTALVKHEGSSRDSDTIIGTDDMSVFMTEPVS